MFYRKEVVKMEVEPVPSVNLRCRVCDQNMSVHSRECSSAYLRDTRKDSRDSDYLWLVNYFQKCRDGGGIWGKWIQDSLNMTVTYHDMPTVV